MELVARQPSLAALSSGRQQLLDLSGDGQLDLVEFDGPTPGFFERTEDESWEPFTPFASLPVLDWQQPQPEVHRSDRRRLRRSADQRGRRVLLAPVACRRQGFGPAQRVPQALDEEKGPKLVFADGTESIFLADLSGDGLTDLVRIRNGEVCYWPNLGYGRFGAKVTMDNAPWFDRPDLFDGRRIRLADIDGSGTTDIIYFASDAVQLYFNQSGNAWGDARVLSQLPTVDSVSSATALDLLGNGTACLVWSSPLPGNARRPMRYIDLMGGQKPHLLVSDDQQPGRRDRRSLRARPPSSTWPTSWPGRPGSPGCRSRCTSSSGWKPTTTSAATSSSPATPTTTATTTASSASSAASAAWTSGTRKNSRR